MSFSIFPDFSLTQTFEDEGNNMMKHTSSSSSRCDSRRRKLPPWTKSQIPQWGNERLIMNEWEMDECINSTLDEECDIINDDDDDEEEVVYNDDVDEYRRTNGWIGSDLCHSRHSSVRVSHYTISYDNSHSNNTLTTDVGRGGVGTKLTGLCHFTESAESHKGYCHDGSMTAVMDDIIGWTAFCVTGRCIPWSGYTVQINVTLKHPVQVGSYLILRGTIVNWDGKRKVWVEATLFSNGICSSSDKMKKVENKCSDDDDEEIVYCTAEGLVLLNNNIINLV